MINNKIRISLFLLLLFLFSSKILAEELKIGDKAPNFSSKNINGKYVSLKNYKNKKLIVLSFFATWCWYCLRELPELEEIHKKYKNKGLEILLIDYMEDPAIVKRFIQKSKVKLTFLLDTYGKVTYSYSGACDYGYGQIGIPFTIFLNKDGIIINISCGYNPNLASLIEEEMQEIIGKKNH